MGYLVPNLNVEGLKLRFTPSVTAVRPGLLNVDYVLVSHIYYTSMEVEVDKAVVVVSPGSSCAQPRYDDP